MNINKIILIINLISFSCIYSMEVVVDDIVKSFKLAFELHSFIINNEKNKVELLISKNSKAIINLKDKNGRTALMLACMRNNKEIVELLIKSGSNINEINNDGRTALIITIIHGYRHSYYEVIKLLIKSGINVDTQDKYQNTALIQSIWSGHKEIVELLIKAGASLNLKNNKNKTALDEANESQHKDILSFMIDSQKKREEIVKLKQELFNAIKFGDFNNVRELIKKVTLNLHDENGNNVLHLAAINNQAQIFKLVLGVRADLIKEINTNGITPIEFNPALDNYSILKIIFFSLDNNGSNKKRKRGEI